MAVGPAKIEDFLWDIHSVVTAFGAPLPVDQLNDLYFKHLGHKCTIERFLVIGAGGLAATLKRIPHIVTVAQNADGTAVLTAKLPAGATQQQLVAADQAYRRQLQAKNAQAKVATKAKVAGAAPAEAPAAAVKASAAAVPAATGNGTATGHKRPPPEAAGPDAKMPRREDADRLGKMLIQGIVRVLQNRVKSGSGSLPVSKLEEEFKALWKVPFDLKQAGESDEVVFLQKWPNKVEVVTEGGDQVVKLVQKATNKAEGPVATPTAHTPEVVPLAAGAAANVVHEVPQNLQQVQQQATKMLQEMQDMMRRQEALVNALGRLSA